MKENQKNMLEKNADKWKDERKKKKKKKKEIEMIYDSNM